MTTRNYKAAAHRSQGWRALEVTGGACPIRPTPRPGRLDQAGDMVRDLLALHFGISTHEAGHIEVAPELDAALAEEVSQTRQARARSSSRGTPPWSLSCGVCSTSLPGQTPGPGLRPGGRSECRWRWRCRVPGWVCTREFSSPRQCRRRLGTGLLREAMAIRRKVNLASYDRLFPSQHLLPASGVGNLIALPLFRSARDRNATVFLNLENLEPHQDQWSYLSTLGRMTPREVSRAADMAGRVPAGSEVTRLASPTNAITSTPTRPALAE